MHKLYCDKSELSVGQLYLLDICDRRKITEFWNSKLNQQFTVGYLMNVASGKYKIPSLKFINSMVPFVKPDLWFYTEKEYADMFDFYFPLKDEEIVTDIRLSKNFCFIMKIYEEKQLWTYCMEKFGKDKFQNMYMIFFHIVKGRNSVSPVLINELKPILEVQDWFRK